MTWHRTSLALVLAATLCLASANSGASKADKPAARSKVKGSVVELTELNFDELVSVSKDPWMLDVFAPWCPACQELEPAWKQLAEVLAADGIRVGKIDGTKERGLLSRFQVQHFPTIYRVGGGETREYEGVRSVEALAAFAREGWREVEPRKGCRSPVSTCGRMLGEVTKVPARFKHYYHELHDNQGWGELSLFAGLLAVPVTLGLMMICALDAYNTWRPLPPTVAQHHHHE